MEEEQYQAIYVHARDVDSFSRLAVKDQLEADQLIQGSAQNIAHWSSLSGNGG